MKDIRKKRHKDTKMVDYSKTKIYRIPVENENYYGHTAQPLHKRKSVHKTAFNTQHNRKIYKAMREANMTVDDIELIWVEDYPCENVYQARARERYWVERDGALNMYVPNRSQSEWCSEKWYNDETFRQNKIENYLKWKNNKKNDEVYVDRIKAINRQRAKAKRKNDEEWRLKDNQRCREKYRDRWANDVEFRQKDLERKKKFGLKRMVCDECGKEMRRDSITRHKKQSCKGKTS